MPHETSAHLGTQQIPNTLQAIQAKSACPRAGFYAPYRQFVNHRKVEARSTIGWGPPRLLCRCCLEGVANIEIYGLLDGIIIWGGRFLLPTPRIGSGKIHRAMFSC